MKERTDPITPTRSQFGADHPWPATRPDFDKSAAFADPVNYLRGLGLESELVMTSDRLAAAA